MEWCSFFVLALEQPIPSDVLVRWRAVTENADKSEEREVRERTVKPFHAHARAWSGAELDNVNWRTIYRRVP